MNDQLYSDQKYPTFDKYKADTFFQKTYNITHSIDPARLNWFPYIDITNLNTPFNMSPIKPKDIKSVLKKKSSNSSPGMDGITYGILKKLPATNHFLATPFNKVLESGSPPQVWCHSRITLLHKKGSTDEPTNFRMIALSSCVGKLFHQILADRFDAYLTKNNLIDTSYQKAFIKGKNGCIEHNQLVHEILQDAKSKKKKTIHMTWFDLQDAFGSVSHDLIKTALSRNGVPLPVRTYINSLYSSLTGFSSTKSWISDPFPFKKGIFQGDPLSPIIFIMCFNPIIEYLQTEKMHGYIMNDMRYITAPFADDFCLITRNKKTHQRLINKIQDLTTSMGLTLKPVKCRSLSIQAGRPTDIPFTIGANVVPTLFESEHKFLGSLVTAKNTDLDVFNYIKDKLTLGLHNIDKSLVRNEYKLRIYSKYFLPSLRFHLTVNDLAKTHLDKLDAIARRSLKKWAGIPHPGSVAFLHMPQGLDIKSIPDLYLESHALAHVSTRLKGDEKVNKCLDNRLDRELGWSKKHSFVVDCESLYANASADHVENGRSIKDNVKRTLKDNTSALWHNHVKSLSVQGRTLELLALENNCTHWKSIIYDLPQNICKFVINSLTDTLNHNSNLVRWGKKTTDRCTTCKNKETLCHVLNNCPVYLDQGRYTWRHDNILSFLQDSIKTGLDTEHSIRADLDPTTGTTIPLECAVTNLRPDITVQNKESKELCIIELSVPFEPYLDNAHTRKSDKYAPLVNDITDNGYTVSFYAIEIGSRGFINARNKSSLKSIHKTFKIQDSFKQFLNKVSKLAIISSFVIYHAKSEPTWTAHNVLKI